MRDHIIAVLLILTLFGSGVGLGGSLNDNFTPNQCNVVPTGRVHKSVAAITADGGKPVGVVETVTAIEYATICEKMEWR